MEKLKERFLEYLPDLGGALIILVVGILIVFVIRKIMKKAMGKSKIDPSLAGFLIKLISLIGYVLVVIAVLTKMEVNTTGLIAVFSAAMAGVAIALKDHLADIASGIVILFTRPFVTGDFIEFGSHKGFVEKIDIMHTKVRTYSDTEVIVPNSKITTTEVNNYSSSPEIRVELSVPISYAADIDKTKAVLMNTAKNTKMILTDEKYTPQIRLEKYDESSLDFRVRCWCDFKDYWQVYYQLTENIKKSLDENNIPIPYNQLDVHIVENKS